MTPAAGLVLPAGWWLAGFGFLAVGSSEKVATVTRTGKSQALENTTSCCVFLPLSRGADFLPRKEQSIQWPYVFVFEWVMQKADPFLFSTGFLLPDSQ